MNDFLLELMVEEIPSRIQSMGISTFEKLMTEELEKYRIVFDNLQSYVSPRRIVFGAKLAAKSEEFFEEKKGPQINASPEVISNFLKANRVSRSDCFEKEINKKNFLFVKIKHESINTAKLLGDIIKNAIYKIPWEKSMHWGKHQFYFVRPLRGIMAIYNGKHFKMGIDEIELESRNFTFGHRFLAPQKIHAENIESYLDKMRNAFVIVDSCERKNLILNSFKLNFPIEIDEKLLEEVVGLVEYPVVLVGKIPEKFMKLPEEAIIVPMRVHQRYFPVRIDGKLAPFFAFVSNNIAVDGGKNIIRGNERVLNARLEDALFFFETDLQVSLESRLEKLKKIVFNDKLGTVFERVNRISSICDYICEDLKQRSPDSPNENTAIFLRRASLLAKCDLATNMVSEFPELQGIIGACYAQIQGEKSEVCQIIKEQYHSTNDISNHLSALFSLADKIEIIVSLFAIGKEPTGSKDPFALRRAAIGILKIIKKFSIDIDLSEIIRKALLKLSEASVIEKIVEKIRFFINERFKSILEDSEIEHEIAIAVVEAGDTPLNTFLRAGILNNFLQSDLGKKTIAMCKRIKNIILDNRNSCVDESLFQTKEEKNLLDQIKKFEHVIVEIDRNSSKNFSEKLQEKLWECAKLHRSVSDFFDEILINSDELRIKQNRINLLTKLINIADTLIPL
ncbi:MAG: glycine--tRNA ligase subunit beta [Holosporaceae bacterium]|jgi:glycyl-tRNA synthetase beta chain|nr:glycine--tRNA ligase subunit beta [Holosporaceae bacterium]